MKLVEGLYYSKDHEWVRLEGNRAYIGITDFAQHQLGDIVYVELPDLETEYAVHDRLGIIESVKAVADLHSPISGRVIEVNADVEGDPALINGDAFEAWICVIEVANMDELTTLMSAEEYKEFANKA